MVGSDLWGLLKTLVLLTMMAASFLWVIQQEYG